MKEGATMKDIQKIALECIDELRSIGINVRSDIKFEVNRRAKRRWGQCRWRGGNVSISIAERLLADEVSDFPVRNTMIHELLHALPDCKYDGHGSVWTRYAHEVNERLGYNIKRCSNYDEYGIATSDEKYVFTCADCGQRIAYTRRSKFTEHYELYLCGICGGKFVKGEAEVVSQLSLFEGR